MLRMILAALFAALFVLSLNGCDFERPFANDAVISEISTSFKSGDTTYEVDATDITATMPNANTIKLYDETKELLATITLHTDTPPAPVMPQPEPEPVGEGTAKIISTGIIVTTPGMNDISISLDQDMSELERLYGSAIPGDLANTLRFNNPRFGKIEIRLDGSKKVSRIYIRDPKYKSDKGVGIGSTRDSFNAAYGMPIRTTEKIDFYAIVPGSIILIVTYNNNLATLVTLASI